jgi:hypothetical protein
MAIGLLRLPSRGGRLFTWSGAARIQIEQNPQRRGVFLAPRRALTRTVGVCNSLSTTRRTVWTVSSSVETVPAQAVGVQPRHRLQAGTVARRIRDPQLHMLSRALAAQRRWL